MPEPDPSSEEVLTGELVEDQREDDSAPGSDEQQHREEIDHPTRLLRIAGMVKGLLTEVETTELDEAARDRLGSIHGRSVEMLREMMSDELAAELDDLSLDLGEGVPSGAELRVAQAQLAGWLEGLFHGIQASTASRRLTAMQRAQLGQAAGDDQGNRSTTGQYL